MRTLTLVLAAGLPLALAGSAVGDHIQPGFAITTWCEFLAPGEEGCTHVETFSNRHIHWFGVTPRLGASLPDGGVVTVTLSGIVAFTNQPFTASRTCELGFEVFTPQPTTPVAGVNNRINNELGDMSLHQSCRVDIHTNFVGDVVLTARAGQGVHAVVDAWVALL